MEEAREPGRAAGRRGAGYVAGGTGRAARAIKRRHASYRHLGPERGELVWALLSAFLLGVVIVYLLTGAVVGLVS